MEKCVLLALLPAVCHFWLFQLLFSPRICPTRLVLISLHSHLCLGIPGLDYTLFYSYPGGYNIWRDRQMDKRTFTLSQVHQIPVLLRPMGMQMNRHRACKSPASGKSHPWLHISGTKHVKVEVSVVPPLYPLLQSYLCA